MTEQPAERCPQCQALVRPGATWCTLCFADLRPPPPAPAPATPSAARLSGSGVAHDGASFDPLTAPLALLDRQLEFSAAPQVPDSPLAEVRAAQPQAETGRAKTTTWPCLGCGATVDLDLAACPACGVGFLAGAGLRDDDLMQRLTRGGIPKTTQAMIIGGGSLLLIVALVGLAYLVAAVF